MPWLKLSDQAPHHPMLMEVLEHPSADDRTLNEVMGWLTRCAAASAAFELDYVVPMGTARQLAGMTRIQELLDVALAVGLVSRTEHEGKAALQIIKDPELWHMIPRA